MQLRSALAMALLALGCAEKVTPVQKVLQLMEGMLAKGKEEKHGEQVQFAAYKQFCDDTTVEKKRAIEEANSKIDMLKADIEKYIATAARLTKEIAEHDEDISVWNGDQKAATQVREIEKADYDALHQDYSESVDALTRAIAVLHQQSHDRKQASLVQVSALNKLSLIPDSAKKAIEVFLQQSPDEGLEVSAPEAYGYEFQSHGVIEMLEKLQDKFIDERTSMEKEEMNGKHAYDMLMQDLTAQVEQSETDRSEKSESKAKKLQAKADAEGSLSDTSSTKDDDVKYLTDLTSTCGQKASDFEERQQLRTEEIEAIGKAIEILSSPEVLGAAEQHLSLAQAPAKKGIALVQLRGGENAEGKTEGIRRRVRDFLEAKGKLLHSDRLTLLAEKMMADPFAKVKKMIDGMITRLLEEANGDADHEGFCDTEMGKSKIARTKLSEDIDGLSAAVEEGNSLILKLSDETAELTQEVQALDEAMAEATKLRVAEKAQNAATVADAKAAQKAVAAATAVLKDFYAKASTATAFIQLKADPRAWGLKTGVKMGTDEWNSLANPGFEGQVDTGHKENMQTFGETEEGQQDVAKYGVLSLLEIIASDFSTLQADTAAAEAAAAEAHERFAVESTKNKSVKMKKVELNEADQASAQAKLQADTVDMKATEDELLAADRYYEKLSPQCVDQGMTFEERTAARQAEIDSLKEALKLLQSEDIATTSL
mmetsp:Transcript_48396/g.156038  ORF Transcript_48396/g.156038 Transcript_48396/m.156038 type:complete len:713 (+) Transcript_48396:69-2207(+)